MMPAEVSVVLDLRGRCRTYEFLDEFSNPGIGGSEAYLVHLGMRLFEAGLDVCIVIVGCGDIKVPVKIPVVRAESWLPGTSVIINSGTLGELLSIGVSSERLIVVSHHPFDQNLRILKRKFKNSAVEIVNLGKFQHESNQFVEVPSMRIPGLWPAIEDISHSPHSPAIIGHIGSLHPSKGFSDVLKILKKLPPQSFDRLEVVGGSALYGGSLDALFDPNSRHGRKIRRLLSHVNLSGKVDFLGLVPDPNEFSSRWSLALLNPKGIGEADSQTLKELHARRVPVFASLHFGLGDFTREHREYGLSGWCAAKDARKVSSFLRNSRSREQFQALIEKRLIQVRNHNAAVSTAWINVLSAQSKARKMHEDSKFEDKYSASALRALQLSIGRLLFTGLWIVDRIRKAK